MGDKKVFCGTSCDSTDINKFCGILPKGHNETGCHHEGQKRRQILCEIKRLIDKMECAPKCEEWDTSATLNNTKGPYRFGVQQESGKSWEPHRVPSRELIGSQLISSCACLKKNGLQDDCRRLQCRGRPWCLTEPLPECPPFTKKPADWLDHYPQAVCPNVPNEKETAEDYEGIIDGCPYEEVGGGGFGACGNPFPGDILLNKGHVGYRLEKISPNKLPQEYQNTPMYKLHPN